MAWAYVNATSNSAAGGSTSLTLNKPSGVADGDLLVAVIATSSNTTFTPPAGWTSVASYNDGADTSTIEMWWKIASGEGASWQWTFGSTKAAGGVVAYTPSAGYEPALQTSTTNETAAPDTVVTASGFTTTHANTLLFGAFAAPDTGASKTFAPPSGMSERVDIGEGASSSISVEVATEVQGSAGATGSKSATPNSSYNQNGIAILAGFYESVIASAGGTDGLFFGTCF